MTPLMLTMFLILVVAGILWGAPAPVGRGTPAGNAMTDGFPVKIACGANPTISFWEKQVMPFGMDGGDPIPTSTMFNILYHTISLFPFPPTLHTHYFRFVPCPLPIWSPPLILFL